MVETNIDTGLGFSVLGPLAADREGRPIELGAPKQKAVLAVLLANHSQPVGVGKIITSVWGADASNSFRRSVQTYVSNLRATLDTEIPRTGDTYMLAIDPWCIDAVRFEETLEDATGLIATNPALAANRLRSALAMWRGRPYSDVSEVEGIQGEINRLEELRLTAVELRIDAELAAGRHRELIAEVEALADEHPLRERFRAQHMIALYRAGRQSEALRVFERTRVHLTEELGIDPSQELQDLELAILRHDQELSTGTGLTTTQRVSILATSIDNLADAWDRNPQVMGESVWGLHETIIRTVEEHGGRTFHESGDGLSAVFTEVAAAVRAAEDAQQEIAELDWEGLEPLWAGIAIDVGEAESMGDRFSGPPVSRARQLAAKAWGGQVLLSSAVQEELASGSISGLQVRQLGKHDLDGFAAPQRVAQLVIDELDSDFDGLRPIDGPMTEDGSVSFSLPGYEIRELIGSGAVGAVYRAYQPSIGREVAIKVIRPTMSNHPRFFHRFETEARVIARLAHPHIVPLIDFWRDSEGAYLVLQYMSGGSLTDALREDGLEEETAQNVVRQIAGALEHAHQVGVAHGDVNPNNILLDEAGNAYLADFDIASRLLQSETDGGVSIPVTFQAPELAETGPSVAADIYAFGKLTEALSDDAALRPLVAKATEPDPEGRFPSVRSLLEEFDSVIGSESTVPMPVARRNPYKGLRPFDEADSGDFYGRDSLVAELIAKVDTARFVTVVGPSGSGKSSAVRAGLVPALARGAIEGSEAWPILVMSPGAHPEDRLAERLGALATQPGDFRALLDEQDLQGAARVLLNDEQGELLLVVDQFEELFAQTQDPERRRRFIELLTSAVHDSDGQLRIVATLRADFYQHVLREPDLNRLAREGQVTVIPPTREELIEMITRPAESVGLRWEAGLAEHIASEVVDRPGGLPLLQYALTEMVENRAGDSLSKSDYEAVGGAAGALVKRADDIFSTFSRDQQVHLREVFLRLVQVDAEGETTRRRVRRSELESLGLDRTALDLLLSPFVAQRILLVDRDPVTRGATVEVAHETLLSSWPRLADWIDEERDSLLLAKRLRAARDEWVREGNDPDYLLTGTRLTPFVEWAKTFSLSEGERTYLEESTHADQHRQQQARRRRRVLAGILGVASVVAIVLSIWALLERNRANERAATALAAEQQAEAEAERAEAAATRAQEEALRAEHNAQLARSRELAAAAVGELDDNPELSMLLALHSIATSPPGTGNSAAGVLALRQASTANHLQARFVEDEDGPVWARITDDGATIYSWAPLEGRASAIDVATGERLWTYDEPGGIFIGEFSRLALSPDEKLVAIFVFAHAVESADPAAEPYVVVLAAADGEVVTVIEPGPCPEPEFSREGFTSDGRWLLISTGTASCGAPEGSEDWVSVYDTTTWEEETRLYLDVAPYKRASFSEAGDRVLIATWNGPAELRSFPDLDLITEFGPTSLASLSPDGEKVVLLPPSGAVGSSLDVDFRPRVHDSTTGERLFYLDAVDDFQTGDGFIFSSDGSRVVATTRTHDYVFSMEDGRLITDLGEAGSTNSAWFTADGRTLMTATDGAVLLWGLPEGSSPDGEPIDPGFAEPVWINPNWALEGPHIALQMLGNHESAGFSNAMVVLDENGDVLNSLKAKGSQLPDGRFVANIWAPEQGDAIWGPLVVWDPAEDSIVELGGCTAPSSRLFQELPVDCPDGDFLYGEPRRASLHVVSPADGSFFATGTYVGRTESEADTLTQTVVVWDTESLEKISEFEVPFREDLFAAGPTWLVSIALGEQELVIRDFSNGEELARFFAGAAPSLELSPDASILFAGDDIGTMRAYDTANWDLLQSWSAHGARVRGLVVSEDLKRLVTTGQDDFVSVWDVSEVQAAGSMPLLLDRIPAPFASDAVWLEKDRVGLFLANGARWMEVSLNIDELVATAMDQLTRSFSAGECAVFEIAPCPSLDDLLSGS